MGIRRPVLIPALLLCAGAVLFAAGADAKPQRLRVPRDYATIQEAVDAAGVGDEIRVARGRWCGAVVNKRIDLVGQGGATIVGCDSSPDLAGFLRIGFFLPDGDASGTTIRNFTFDGEGVSDELPAGNFDPLSFGVFARDADHVVVEHNRVVGTVQAITNTGGSGWTVSHNVIEDLTVFTCSGVDPCGGGSAIVFQERDVPGPRAMNNYATHNVISGTIPDELQLFSMVGIVVFGQQGMVVRDNRVDLPANPAAGGAGQAILVSDSCCGGGGSFLTSIDSEIVNNDGRGSEYSVVITLDSDGGTGNTVGTTLRGNFGVNDINGVASTVTNRSSKTLIEFP